MLFLDTARWQSGWNQRNCCCRQYARRKCNFIHETSIDTDGETIEVEVLGVGRSDDNNSNNNTTELTTATTNAAAGKAM